MTATIKITIATVTMTLMASLFFFLSDSQSKAEAALASDFKVGVALEHPRDLSGFEADIGHRADMFLWYQSISESLDTATLGPIAQGGRTIELAWEPWDYGAPDLVNQPAYRLRNISRGDFDSEIRRWAREIKAFGYPVVFRPMCEMNGDWTSWGGTVNGNQPADFVPAWRHIHDIFVQEGATNATFLWSPNRDGDSDSALYTFNTYYPGDAYVDYIGIDGYNWGTMYKTPEWTSIWQSFEEVFSYSYDTFTARSSKPVLISETACTELGGDKAAWITDAFANMPSRFPQIVGLTWFNYNKETDWRVNSSAASLEAFRAAVAVMAPHEPEPTPEPQPEPAPDTTAPTVSFVFPLPGTLLSRNSFASVMAEDDVGVTRIELYIDGMLVGAGAGDVYLYYFNTHKLGNGTHTLTAIAYDDAGNSSAADLQFEVNNKHSGKKKH